MLLRVLFRIIGLALHHKRHLFGAYLCMIVATLAYLVFPWILGRAIDWLYQLSESGYLSLTTGVWIIVGILIVAVIRGVFSFGQTFFGEALGHATVYDLRNRFYDHVQNLSFGFHDRHHTGDLISRAITDVEAIRMFCNTGLIRTPYFIVLFITVPILLFRIDWLLATVAIAILPIISILSSLIRLRLRAMWTGVQEQMAHLSMILQENLTGIRVVKAFGSEKMEQNKFDESNNKVAQGLVDAERLHAINVSFIMFSFLVILALVMWIGGWRVINGDITPGEFAQVLFYMQILNVPVRWTGMMVNNVARALSAGDRLYETLDTRSPVIEKRNAVYMPSVTGVVQFENVSFSYGKGVPAINNININVESGQSMALLGVPGSGKTTLMSLMSRFYDVSSGRITFDGIDIRDVTLKSLRQNIAVVQQDVFLFPTTIRDNIAYGKPTASFAEIVEATRVAQLEEFIEGLDAGYETVIGERGVTLSGGQRQRLSIARAVLLDPAILILDDSTSSVDAETEDRIRKAMETVMEGRTTFLIAHRLSSVHKADQIIVIDKGTIVEKGNHKTLVDNADGAYRKIYDLQLRPQEEVMLDFEMPKISLGK